MAIIVQFRQLEAGSTLSSICLLCVYLRLSSIYCNYFLTLYYGYPQQSPTFKKRIAGGPEPEINTEAI